MTLLRQTRYFSAFFKRYNIEAFIWLGAFLFLAVTTPNGEAHITLCPLKGLGFSFCPGCGLGRSISHLLHGNIARSFDVHPLGIVAFVVLAARTLSLLYNGWKHPLTTSRPLP